MQLKILAMKCFDHVILCFLLHKLVILCIINLNIYLQYEIDGLEQDCSKTALAMELLQSWTKPSTWPKSTLYSI